MTGGLDVLLRVLPAFLIVIGVPLGVFWWSRRVNAGPGQPLRVVAKATLGRNASVAVVNVGDHHYLVGASEHSVNLISELDDYDTDKGTPVPATTAGVADKFAETVFSSDDSLSDGSGATIVVADSSPWDLRSGRRRTSAPNSARMSRIL